MRKSTNEFYFDTLGSNYSKSFLLRGASLLNQTKLKDVYLSKNRLIILNDKNILLSIDIVPPNKNVGHSTIDQYKSFLHNPNEISSQTIDDLLIYHFSTEVINIQMVNDILFVTQNNGTLMCWFWNDEEYCFDGNISIKLGKDDSQVVYSCIVGKSIFWIEKDTSSEQLDTYILWFTELEIDVETKQSSSNEIKSDKYITNVTNIAILEELPENIFLSPRQEGIWIIFKNSIHYYSIYERWDEVNLEYGDCYFCHHSITGEMILVNEKGDLYVATVKRGEYCITLKHLSTLNDFSYKGVIAKPFIYQHSIAFIYDKVTEIFNIRSGIKLSTFVTPKGKVCRNVYLLSYGDQPNGILRDNNIFILKSPYISEYEKSIRTKLIEGEHNQNVNDKQLLIHSIHRSKDWNLTFTESKFLLELISMLSNFNENDNKNSFEQDLDIFIKSCENLMKYLQNPLILVPILHSSKIPKKYIDEIVNNFLRSIQESKNDVIRTQYMQSLKWYTPMNLALEPLAYSYLKSNVDIRINPKNYTMDEIISNLNSNDFEMIPSARIYQFIEYSPLKMMNLIEKFMGVSHEHLENISMDMKNDINYKENIFNYSTIIPTNFNDIMYRGSTDGKNQYFEILCHTYFYHNTNVFLPFVFLVIESYKRFLSKKSINIDAKSFYERALNVIPLSSDGFNEEQLVSKYVLLDKTGNHSLSLKTMLQNDHWDWAISYIKSKISKGDSSSHAELFTHALLYTLESNHIHKISDIQNLAPNNISSSDLVTSLRIHSENLKTKKPKIGLFCNNENDIPMSAIKGVLQNIIKDEPK